MITAYILGVIACTVFAAYAARKASPYVSPHYPRVFAGILFWPITVVIIIMFIVIETARQH